MSNDRLTITTGGNFTRIDFNDETFVPWSEANRMATEAVAAERERIAQAYEAIDPVEWALLGQHAGAYAAWIARSDGATASNGGSDV